MRCGIRVICDRVSFGLADDLGLPEYQVLLNKVCGTALDLARLGGGEKLLELKADLATVRRPSQRHRPASHLQSRCRAGGNPAKALGKTQGFRLMGQRFVPDSHMLGKLVFPTVGQPTSEGMLHLQDRRRRGACFRAAWT